jgi:hypothetical protein
MLNYYISEGGVNERVIRTTAACRLPFAMSSLTFLPDPLSLPRVQIAIQTSVLPLTEFHGSLCPSDTIQMSVPV